MVIDTDGSAFITKAEFDSLKNNFQAQIDNYNSSIDSKIDGAIASYLSGIKLSTTNAFETIYFNYNPTNASTVNLYWSSNTTGAMNSFKRDNYGINATYSMFRHKNNASSPASFLKINVLVEDYINNRVMVDSEGCGTYIGLKCTLTGSGFCWYTDENTIVIPTERSATGHESYMYDGGTGLIWCYAMGLSDSNMKYDKYNLDGKTVYTRYMACCKTYKRDGTKQYAGYSYRAAFGDDGLYYWSDTVVEPSTSEFTLYPLTTANEYCFDNTKTEVNLILGSTVNNKKNQIEENMPDWDDQSLKTISQYIGAYDDNRRYSWSAISMENQWVNNLGERTDCCIGDSIGIGYVDGGVMFALYDHIEKSHRDILFADFKKKDNANKELYKGVVLGTANEKGSLKLNIKVDKDGHIILYSAPTADALWGGAPNAVHGGRTSATDWTSWSSNVNTAISANVEKEFVMDVNKDDKIFFLYLPNSSSDKGKVLSLSGTLTTEN